jgi:adenine phosphoribosyltransferase
MQLKAFIRDIPDFPIPGILFRDITPLLRDTKAFRYTIDQLAARFGEDPPDAIAAIESRGFLFGAPLAHQMGIPLIPVRKPGKLPAATYATEFSLEYGESTLELHTDALNAGDRVLVVDDLLATGGTLAATARLVEMAGGVVAGIAVIIELSELEGRRQLPGYDVYSLITY